MRLRLTQLDVYLLGENFPFVCVFFVFTSMTKRGSNKCGELGLGHRQSVPRPTLVDIDEPVVRCAAGGGLVRKKKKGDFCFLNGQK